MQVQLGGTNMRVDRGLQGGRRGDAIDLSDESWQPSKLELQARLGASKERQLELEWRLQQAEQKIAQAQVQTPRIPLNAQNWQINDVELMAMSKIPISILLRHGAMTV